MSILDSVKSRFRSNDDDWDEDYDDYGDDDYDDYGDDGDYGDDEEGSSDGVARWPESLDSSDRRSNRLEDGTPLVTSTDVRSAFRASDRAAHEQPNSVPNYNSASNYKIESRDGLTRASNHSPETLEAARQELDQLQQGVEVPLDSYSGGGPKVTAASRRIETVRIRDYEDAQDISEAIKSGSSVAVSLATVSPEVGKRVLDFCFGVVSVTGGSFESLGNNVYFLSRGGGAITEAEKQELKDEGLL